MYLHYLDQRADSVLGALRLIAESPGATIVHCAAGKDRTGTVVAIALAEVGVSREAIVADYARSAERIEAIFDRLRGTRTYADDIGDRDAAKHAPKPITMQRLLDALDAEHGGAPAWLRSSRLDRRATPRRCAASCWTDIFPAKGANRTVQRDNCRDAREDLLPGDYCRDK